MVVPFVTLKIIFNVFRRHTFNDSWGYFEVLQMEQPHIILWWSFIGCSWGGAKEQSIVSLIITLFKSACLDPSKTPSSGEAIISLCNYRMEHSSKCFGTLTFTLEYAYEISKVSQVIGEWCTFEFFIIQSTIFCLNALLTFFVQTMHGLIDHFNAVFLTWAIKCPRFVEAVFCWRYELDLLHWSKSWIALTSFWSVLFDGYDTMDTILDMTKDFLSSIFFVYFQQMLHGTIFVFVCVGELHWHIVLEKWCQSPP